MQHQPQPVDVPTEGLMSTEATARFLGTTVGTLAVWRTQGRGPAFVKIGRSVKYTPATLRSYIEARQRNSTSQAA